MYNVYICVWRYSYRLQPSILPGERVSQINKNQIKIKDWNTLIEQSTVALTL